jgi:streptogramin lyase
MTFSKRKPHMLHRFCKLLSLIPTLFLCSSAVMGLSYALIPSFLAAQEGVEAFPNAICLASFNQFSYGDGDSSPSEPFAYATPAWTLYTSVPFDLIPNLPVLEESQRSISATVIASRRYNDQHELWVSGSVRASNFRQSFLAIYQPESNVWEFVSQVVSDPNLFYQSFFVTPDGTVWASNQWLDNALPAMTSVPVLSRFNDVTRQFELVETTPQVQVMGRSQADTVNLRPQITLDEQGIFWIFNINASLYRFDPSSGLSERRLDLTTIVPRGVYETALAPNGTIYFREHPVAYSDLVDDAVFQYQPVTNETIRVPLPQEGWPNYDGLYVDSRNWLWLATVGYQDETGEWHLLHTAVDQYFENRFRSDSPHFAAEIFTETSDGRLWTTKFEGGTAWLNPVAGTGCLILSNRRLVFEDIEGYVWIGYGTQGELYRYDATP